MLFINIIVPVFILISCGWILERHFTIDLKALTISSLYLFAPALVLSALLKQPIDTAQAVNVLLYMIVYTVTMLALAGLCGRIFRLEDSSRQALALGTAMMNIGNFGLPLTFFAFGDAGIPSAVLVFVIFSLPLGSLAIVIAQGKQVRLGVAVTNSLKIPIFHAVLIALAMHGLDIEMPNFLMRAVELLGQAAVPLMLVLLGMQISKTRWQVPLKFMLLASVLRLMVSPVIGWAICHGLKIEGLSRDVLILQTSTPAAVLPLLYALRFNSRPDLVASTIMVTTLLSAGSLTIVLYLLPILP